VSVYYIILLYIVMMSMSRVFDKCVANVEDWKFEHSFPYENSFLFMYVVLNKRENTCQVRPFIHENSQVTQNCLTVADSYIIHYI